MTDPRFEYRFGGSNGAQPDCGAQRQADIAQQNARTAAEMAHRYGLGAQRYVRTPEEMAEMARAARQHPQNAYMREFYARQTEMVAAQRGDIIYGDVIDGEYTVVDVPLLGPPDDQADE